MEVGYFGRAKEDGHSARSTQVHALLNGKVMCGYKPHPTMKFQWCAFDTGVHLVECPKCKEKTKELVFLKLGMRSIGKKGR